jgi:putative ABC transport system substrate-binding protein
MRRRDFITLVGGMAVGPLAARAQQKPMPVIGYTTGATLKLSEGTLARVRRGLAEQGYVEGQNFRFELREGNFHNDLVPALFRELVDQQVSVIITVSSLQLHAARTATQSIPIVFNLGIDPVKNGFVASLNRPGGNVTGVFTQDELESAFETAVRGGAGGMIVGADAVFYAFATQLVALADRYRLPTMYMEVGAPIFGGLISYSTDAYDADRLMGNYVGRILKGEKPADIPVQQSTRTKLIINLKTAKSLGITVPTSLLVRADEVIE